MSLLCVNTAQCKCSFGAAPSPIAAAGTARVSGQGLPAATITDIPKVPFGMCSCTANPAVASATSAAFGALTPAPCTPVIVTPWMPGSQTVLIGGVPALNLSCKTTCAYGGIIELVGTPSATVQIP